MTEFIPGLELSEGYYRDAVGPLLAKHYPDLKHAAALAGGGSDVMGFDTEASMDHDWGPRMQLFLPNGSGPELKAEITDFLKMNLPFEHRGFSTNFVSKSNEKQVRLMQMTDTHPVNHLIEVTQPIAFIKRRVGLDVSRELTEREWMSISQNRLLDAVGGKVFHDEVGLTGLRKRIEWYPREVWIFLMGCTWWRVRRWERAMGHCGYVGDELGASVLAARIARDYMRLAFYMERTYAPYSKWFGSAFARLQCAERLGPQLEALTHAERWQGRDEAYARIIATMVDLHNALGITYVKENQVKQVGKRPFRIIHTDKIGRALFRYVESPYLSGLFHRGITGNIDLITDNVDVALSASRDGKVLDLFEPQDGEEVKPIELDKDPAT